ncbi:MAG: hypothetical protein ACYDA6_03180 [Solirubrobacteraceae bacterium]
MIVEHWIRPARDGGLETDLRCADGRTLTITGSNMAALRRTVAQWLALTDEGAQGGELGGSSNATEDATPPWGQGAPSP